LEEEDLLDFSAADPQFGESMPALRITFKPCEGSVDCIRPPVFEKWLATTSLVLMYTTERVDPEAYGTDMIKRDTVIKNLYFATD